MFWLRFFGPRVRDNNASVTFRASAATPDAQPTKLKACDDRLQEVRERSDSFADEENVKPRGGRRSAIDLSNASYSLDIGPQAVYRLSFDMFANPSNHLASLLKGFRNFTTLHRGNHSRILKAEKKLTDEQVIFKFYDKRNMRLSQIDDVTKELEVLKQRIQGTVELLDVFEDDRVVLLNMGECARGTLMAFVDDCRGCLTEELCIKYLVIPLLKTLCSLHEAGVIHRDIKPEHILFDDHLQLRLCDFHRAGMVGRDAFTDREGTLSYMAPEVLSKPTPEEIFHIVLSHGVDETDLPSYNEKVDIWSLGIVIVETLMGTVPFLSDTAEGMMSVLANHFSGENYSPVLRQLECSGRISKEGFDFVSKIIQEDPNDRPDAASLLNHPWLDIVPRV